MKSLRIIFFAMVVLGVSAVQADDARPMISATPDNPVVPGAAIRIQETNESEWRLEGRHVHGINELLKGMEAKLKAGHFGWIVYSESKLWKPYIVPPQLLEFAKEKGCRVALHFASGGGSTGSYDYMKYFEVISYTKGEPQELKTKEVDEDTILHWKGP